MLKTVLSRFKWAKISRLTNIGQESSCRIFALTISRRKWHCSGFGKSITSEATTPLPCCNNHPKNIVYALKFIGTDYFRKLNSFHLKQMVDLLSSGVCSIRWILAVLYRAGLSASIVMLREKQPRRARICTQFSKSSTPLCCLHNNMLTEAASLPSLLSAVMSPLASAFLL